ncbi:MAG: MFS transporter [Alphaproteobacteria bacterium]
MRSVLFPVSALLLGTALLLLGGGLYATLLAVRGIGEGFSSGTIGFVMGAYYLGFLFGCLGCPRLVRNVGHIRTYAALTAIASAASLSHILLVDAVFWAVLRGIAGFCFAGLYMVIESWLNDRASTESRGQIFAIYMMVNLGALGFGQLLLLTAESSNFVLFCGVSILISLAAVPLSLASSTQPVHGQSSRLTIRRLWQISPLGLVACIGVGLGQGSFWSLTPVLTTEAGLGENGTAIFMTCAIFGGLALQWPIGWVSDRYDRRAVICGVSFVSAGLAATIALLAFRTQPMVFYLFGIAYGGWSFAVYSLAVSHANDSAQKSDIVSLSASLLLAYAVGAVGGPLISGLLMELTDARALYAFVALVFMLIGGFAIYRLIRQPPIPAGDKTSFVAMARAGTEAGLMDPRGSQDPQE